MVVKRRGCALGDVASTDNLCRRYRLRGALGIAGVAIGRGPIGSRSC